MDQQPAGAYEVRLQFPCASSITFFTAVALDRPSMASSFSPTDNAMAGYSLKSASSFSRWSGWMLSRQNAVRALLFEVWTVFKYRS